MFVGVAKGFVYHNDWCVSKRFFALCSSSKSGAIF